MYIQAPPLVVFLLKATEKEAEEEEEIREHEGGEWLLQRCLCLPQIHMLKP